MCETFHLEFNEESGIVAWADGDLYTQFAGPAMQQADFWKIHLGRRIKLDDDDLDGSQFLEDLLEDAILFPLRTSGSNRFHERWEIVEESPGIWVTRPMGELEVEDIDNSDDPDENGSDEDDYFDEVDQMDESAEAALENPTLADQSNSAIRANQYETSGDETDSDGEAEMDDPDWAFHSREPDTGFSSDEAESVKMEDDDDDARRGIKMEETDARTSLRDPNDSADSDFDSDEVLSGDEFLLEQ
jgi:hypothetical protein